MWQRCTGLCGAATGALLLLAQSTVAAQPPAVSVESQAPAAAHCAETAATQHVAGGVSALRLRRLTEFLRAATGPGSHKHLGALAMVQRRGHLAFRCTFGHRDLTRLEPLRPDAIFRIYSMTKPMASVALLMLMEEGRLTLEDHVARYLPEFANLQWLTQTDQGTPVLRQPARSLTLRDLLTHTAGFATRRGDRAQQLLDQAAPWQASTLQDYASRVAGVPLAAEPGTRFAYDGVNTEVLSRVVEVVAGEAFDSFLQRRLFAPLGMRDTGFSVPTAQRGRVVDITSLSDSGELGLAPGRSAAAPGEPLNAYTSGAGGLYSTASDLMRFASMLLADGRVPSAQGQPQGPRLLGHKTVQALRSNHLAHLDPLTGLAPGEGFGLGVSVVVDPARRGRLSSIGAYGWSGAAGTTFTIDPEEEMIAILLVQHLPRDDATPDLPRLSVPFYNLVYQSLEP